MSFPFPFFRKCCEANFDADANENNTFTSLPLEILLLILDYTAPDPNQRWKWICAIGSISRRFREIVRQNYAPTVLDLSQVFAGSRSRCSADQIPWICRTSFFDSFSVAPWKASSITRIKFLSKAFIAPQQTQRLVLYDYCPSVRHLLSVPGIFPNVQHVQFSLEFNLDGFLRAVSLEKLAGMFPKLTKLTIVGEPIVGEPDSLFGFQDTHSVYDTHRLFSQMESFGNMLQRPMHTLQLDGLSGFSAEDVFPFFRNQGNNLQVLEFLNCQPIFDEWSPVVSVMAEKCSHLFKLSITQADITAQDISTLIQSCPSLVDINVSGCNNIDGDEFLQFLIKHAPNLQSFRGNGCKRWLDDEFLLDLVGFLLQKATYHEPISFHTIGVKRTSVSVFGLRQVLKQVSTLGRGEGVVEACFCRNDILILCGYAPDESHGVWRSLVQDFPDVNFKTTSFK